MLATRSRSRITNAKFFNIDHRSAETKKSKGANVGPAKRDNKFEALERPRNNFLSMSAKERSPSHNSQMDLPKFGNDKWKSQMSDGVDLHPLAQIDDYDISGEMRNQDKE